MAFANPSSSSTSTIVPTMSNSISQINPSLLLLSNMSAMVTVKLDYSNFIIWKHQIEVILETYFMIDAIDGFSMAPDQFLKDSSSNFTNEVNPAFLNWKNCEQALYTFFNSTLSSFVLALTVRQKSGRGVRKVLKKLFASVSRSSVMSLRNELNAVKKGEEWTYGFGLLSQDGLCFSRQASSIKTCCYGSQFISSSCCKWLAH